MDSFSFFKIIFFIALIIIFVVIPIFVFRPLAKKAGYSAWWALVMVIPVVNIVTLWVFSFVDWPVQKALEENNSNEALDE